MTDVGERPVVARARHGISALAVVITDSAAWADMKGRVEALIAELQAEHDEVVRQQQLWATQSGIIRDLRDQLERRIEQDGPA